MIFLTVGTQLPYERLIRAVDLWCENHREVSVFAQTATLIQDGYIPQHMEHQAFMEPDLYKQKLEQSDLIISHAGMGSIITALTVGKPIVIMPRKASLNEHRNDHQLATAEQFQSRKGIHIASDEKELPDILDHLVNQSSDIQTGSANSFANQDLIDAVRNFILGGS
ncbi:MAG: glycosyltransferase [Sneathiella sp.]